MEDSILHNLRGNLKAKISMACGCLTIATRNAMHERLIVNNETGFLFNSYHDLEDIVKIITTEKLLSESMAFNGNLYVANNFTRENHALQICRFVEEMF
jgi:hypothetical protein